VAIRYVSALSSGAVAWPGTTLDPGTFEQLTRLELLALTAKLCNSKRRAMQVAVHSRSLGEVWDMIRLINDLADVADDLDRSLMSCS
jgi:hypothetical protein